MELVPINFDEAKVFVKQYHRHHSPPVGHKFSIAAAVGGEIVAVVIVGRPVSRVLDNGFTLEVIRLCTNGQKNACSFLYSAAWRVTRNLGYRRLITYILKSESGKSLEASGWKALYETSGGSWTTPSRPRVDKHPLQCKILYEAQ
jgi:hypothetical protein